MTPDNSFPWKTLGKYLIGGFLLLYAATKLFGSDDEKPSGRGAAAPLATRSTERPEPTDVEELMAAFHANEVAAERQYKGKLLRVVGRIQSISTTFTGNPMITLTADKPSYSGVVASFDKDAADTDRIATLKKGQMLAIVGRCAGMMMGSVHMSDPRLD